MPVKKVSYGNIKVNVRLPRGARALTSAQASKIQVLESLRRKGVSTAQDCVIFFPRGSDSAVQRCAKNRGKKTTTAGACEKWAAGRSKCLKRAGVPKRAGGRPVPGRRSTKYGETKRAGGLSKAAKRRMRAGKLCVRGGKLTTKNCRKRR